MRIRDGLLFNLGELLDYFADNGVEVEELPGGIEEFFDGWQTSYLAEQLEDGRRVKWIEMAGQRGHPPSFALAEIVRHASSPVTAASANTVLPTPKPGGGGDTKRAHDAAAAQTSSPVKGAQKSPAELAIEAQAAQVRTIRGIVGKGDIRPARLYLRVAAELDVDESTAALMVRQLRTDGHLYRHHVRGTATYSLRPPQARDSELVTRGDALDPERDTPELSDADRSIAKTLMGLMSRTIKSDTTLLEPREILTAWLRDRELPPDLSITDVKRICRGLAKQGLVVLTQAKEGKGRRARAKRATVLKIGFPNRRVINFVKKSPEMVGLLIDTGESLDQGMLPDS